MLCFDQQIYKIYIYLHIFPKMIMTWNCDYLNIIIPIETLKYTSVGKIWIYILMFK